VLGEPLFDLKLEAGQVYYGTVPPLVVRYAVFEDLRLVFVPLDCCPMRDSES
jgi:hypothetical protein